MKRKVKFLFAGIFSAALSAVALVGCDADEVIKQFGCDHDYGVKPTEILVESTCINEGEELWTCRYCGKQETVEVAKRSHNKDEGVVVEESTCKTEGRMLYKCMQEGCDAEFLEAIACVPHANVIECEAELPTCTTSGHTAYSYCEDCNGYVVPIRFIPALGHSVVVDKAVVPTCLATGLTVGEHCALCGEVFKAQEEVAAVGHTVETLPAVAPTCKTDGKTAGSACSVCGEVIVAQEVIASLGGEHVLGETDGNCIYCGMHEHTFDASNTCFTCGVHEHVMDAGNTCIYCELHIHVEETVAAVAATCTATGLTEGTVCAHCGAVLVAQEVVPARGHVEEIIPGVEATCQNSGLTDGVKCSTCGEILEEQEEIPQKESHELVDRVCIWCGMVIPGIGTVLPGDWGVIEGN